MSGSCGNARGKNGNFLRAGGKRAYDVNTFYREQFTDLLEPDFKFPGCDDPSYRVGLNFLALAFYLVEDSEFRKKFREEIDAAGAVGIGNRLCVEQSFLQRVDRADVRLW